MPFVELGDIKVYHQVAGQGPRLLYISGTGGDLRRRPSVFDGAIAPHFELLAYDQRGLGQTSIPEGPYAMADYARDAAGLLDALGWERCHVMGVSFGGMVAQEFAVTYPERIERLVLACTSSGGAGGRSYPLHEIRDLPDEERAHTSIALSDVRRDAAWQAANPERMERLLEITMAGYEVGRGESGREEGQRRQLEARSHHDVWERLGGLEVPTLVCGGKYDGIAPPDNLVATAQRIQGSRLELFEGGHLFLLEDKRAPERVVEFLTEES